MYEYRKLNTEERVKIIEERLERGFPPHSPPHLTGESGLYLLTAACYEHKHHMGTAVRRKQVLDRLFELFTLQGDEIRAWVVLTNHYHLLLFAPEGMHFGRVLRLVHGRTSYQWNKEDRSPGRKVWYRYSDRAMRSERHYFTTLNYIHYNPVKHELASSPYNWDDSSVHWYLSSFGREWLRDVWRQYPVRDYGRGWDSL
jgi:putative transposase